ncbi:MAG: AIPR family protein [Lewinellaceae bacterium]|nr:AIPR family protein [Lewinellaceae bacterium]
MDGIVDDRLSQSIPSNRRDEVFEYLCSEQILKDYGLSSDEILDGVVDGRNDGGIDSIYILVNGHIVKDANEFLWPKSGCELSVVIITCKHHDTFKLLAIDSLVASLSEILDFSLENEKLSGDYNLEVLDARMKMLTAYRKTSPRLQKFTFNVFYASRGDSNNVGENIVSRSNQLVEIVKGYFSNVEASFNFFGSAEIIESYRKSQIYSYDLKFQKVMSKGETYLLLVSLKDYYSFITDDKKLKRYYFDSNVRAYMGLNSVNQDIRQTLEDTNSPDFWWLNNGVTILTTNAVVVGNSITIENVQIVNGLQTTESIFQFYDKKENVNDERSILIKVIVSNQSEVRDQIIRATNNQTVVESVALFATDKIQRDIEEIMLKKGFYYERRTNYYANQGVSPKRIITPLYLAAGITSLCLKMPWVSASFKSKMLREENLYRNIFLDQPLNIFPVIGYILKQTDQFIETTRPSKGTFDAYQRRYRHILSSMIVARLCNSLNFTAADIMSINLDDVKGDKFQEMWNLLHSNKAGIGTVKTSRKKNEVIRRLNLLTKEFEIKGIERYRRMPNSIFISNPKQTTSKVRVFGLM